MCIRDSSKAEMIDEKLMDVVTAVSGSSPAYVFMFIEAMADAAVAGGMPRSQAYTFAAQAVLGSCLLYTSPGCHRCKSTGSGGLSQWKKKAIGALVGQTMKATNGKANPAVVNKLLMELL